jgi:RNA polymerase sigma factor (sigma-70 family)
VSAATGPHDAGVDFPATTRTRRRVPVGLLRLASDERLVEMLRGGSEPAFEALFDRHHRGVLGFCRHMLGSVEEAEDAVQHTFLAAYRELTASDKSIQLRPWLYTIARNRCLTVLRSRSRQALGELQEPPTEHLAAEVERRQDLRALLGDVSRLPDDQRAALVLSELGDMPHDEIAAVLGCRREKVKALVFQARSSLIISRSARDTSCRDIRELLASLTGGSLRRNDVRRHLAECAGCREFREQVRRQRRELAVVLPVAPTVGLKAAVVGGSAVVAGSAGGAVAAKVLIVAAIVGGGTAAVEVEKAHDKPARQEPAPTAPATPSRAVAPAAPAAASIQRAATATPTKPAVRKAASPGKAKKHPATRHRGHAKKQSATLNRGQAKKESATLNRGQAKKQTATPNRGQAKKQSKALNHGQAKKQTATPNRGQAKKQSATPNRGQAKKEADASEPGPAPNRGQAKKSKLVPAAPPAAAKPPKPTRS